MGLFDNNIHMNGAGTTYQSFLNLADAAEEKGGKIGDRTVRLVKAGDGLATTTSSGLKGDRAVQISQAREVFLTAIAREFGYAARSIAEKTLGEAVGQDPVPLTARSIRAVNEALGDKDALAARSALVRENKMEFDVQVAFVLSQLGPRMGTTKAELDCGRIQAETLKLIGKGDFSNDADGLRAAVREVAAKRVAVAVRLESVLREKGVPEHMVRRLAETAIDQGVAIVDDASVADGEAVSNKLFDLAVKHLADNGKDFFEREGAVTAALFDAEKLISDAFGEDALQTEDSQKALDSLKSKLEKLQDAKMGLDAFKAQCSKAVDVTVRASVMRRMGTEMMLETSEKPSYGRAGIRLYDALGVGRGPNDRGIDDDYIKTMDLAQIESRYTLDDKGPEGLRSQAFRMVLQTIAADYVGKLPPLQNEHPDLETAKLAVARKVAAEFTERFENAVSAEDFAKLANDFKARLSTALGNVNASLKNIDLARDQAKAELEGRLEQMAGQYGLTVTQGIKNMASRLVTQARDSLQNDVTHGDKELSADECKAAILDRVEKKWLSPCRQAAVEIEASSLDPAQKKAFLIKVIENKANPTHVRIALRAAPAFDASGLAGAAKNGDGGKLAEQFHKFVTSMNAQITDKEELKTIKDSEDYSSCVSISLDLLFVMNPGIEEGVRGLGAGPREKMFDDAVEMSMNKSREIQNQKRENKDLLQVQAEGLDAKYWASATACAMQLQQAVG